MSNWEAVLTNGTPTPGTFTLLVAVGNPDHVPQLLRTAADIARFEGGSIHVVSVIHKPHDSPFGVFDDETIRTEFGGDREAVLERAIDAGEETGVEVTGTVVVARHLASGILQAGEAVDADALLIGWERSRRRSDAVLGTVVDSLLERSQMDVLVERIGTTADGVESVLVPVAGSPHAALAARAGGAIAAANDARLVLLSITTDDVDHETAQNAVETTEQALLEMWEGPDVAKDRAINVHSAVADGTDIADTIVAESAAHDVILMGATRGGALRRRLVGSNAREVAQRTDKTVILTQHSTAQTGPLRLLGRLRRL